MTKYEEAMLITVKKGNDGQRRGLRDNSSVIVRCAIVEFGSSWDRDCYANNEKDYTVLSALAQFGDDTHREIIAARYSQIPETIVGQDNVLGQIARYGNVERREVLMYCYSSHVRAIVAIMGTPEQHDILVYDHDEEVLLRVIEFSKGDHHLKLLDHPYKDVKEAALKKQGKI